MYSNQNQQQLQGYTPVYQTETVYTGRERILPNYDINSNPWVGYDAIGLWLRALRRYPIRTCSVTIGISWVITFLLFATWNFLRPQPIAQQQVDPFNPVSMGTQAGAIAAPSRGYVDSVGSTVFTSATGKPLNARQFGQIQQSGGLGKAVPINYEVVR